MFLLYVKKKGNKYYPELKFRVFKMVKNIPKIR